MEGIMDHSSYTLDACECVRACVPLPLEGSRATVWQEATGGRVKHHVLASRCKDKDMLGSRTREGFMGQSKAQAEVDGCKGGGGGSW